MTSVRLLADDLTGALDTAAELTPLAGSRAVVWSNGPFKAPTSCAIDSGTREKEHDVAIGAVSSLAPALADAEIAYKKVDSLLRGHTMAELAACWRFAAWDHCVVAPAFPFQGRVTVDGVQRVTGPDRHIVADVFALLADAGVEASPGNANAPLGPGIAVFDARTNEDLAHVVACGRAASGRVLWCGSAGLAQALASGAKQPPSPLLRGRVLGLFGSDQAVTARQLAACGDAWLRLAGDQRDHAPLIARLQRNSLAIASLDLPTGTSRAQAAATIASSFASLVASIDQPDVLLVAGGETLRGLCEALGTTSLEVRGQFEPGLPHSVMRGGRWDGVTVVSKSGAFGGPMLWRDLLAAHGHSFSTHEIGSAEKVRA
ncbi:MAG: Hrp-dependent type III effector protein [Methylobacteriaceae bacterium]|nr:Hrp-dependent type III effector protein [Methylobacteriaceae bacterium]